MKKIILLSAVFLCSTMLSFAQLKVFSDGNVGIQLPTDSIAHSPLSVGGVGDSNSLVSLTGPFPSPLDRTFSVLRLSYITIQGTTRGIYATGNSFMGTGIGVHGECVGGGQPYMTGTAMGVLGIAGGYSKNYGVMGVLSDAQSGVGVIGTVNNQNVPITGQYAGYFDGNVAVTGTINGITISSSDIRYKKNIAELNALNALNNILQMKPVSYNLVQQQVEYEEDNTKKQYSVYDEKSQLFQKTHYGLIAQDLKEIYPDLVYEKEDGYLGVNYTELIPVLIQSIQELNGKIESLESELAEKSGVSTGGVSAPALSVREAVLYPNAPNPFSQNTQIKYYLPESVKNASLNIYNLQGKQLKQIILPKRGEGSQLIYASEFPAGIYLYALIADGKKIDTKEMVLTE